MGYVRLLNKGMSLYLNLSQDERKFIYWDRNIISWKWHFSIHLKAYTETVVWPSWTEIGLYWSHPILSDLNILAEVIHKWHTDL